MSPEDTQNEGQQNVGIPLRFDRTGGPIRQERLTTPGAHVLSLPPRAGCRPLLEDLQLRMQRSFVYDGTTEGETKGKITPSHREQAIPWKDFVLS